MITSFLKHRPNANKIKNEFGLPWLKLDINVPYKDILDEFKQIEHELILHRANDNVLGQTHKGWKSLTLYGADKHITEQTNDPYNWQSLNCPKTIKWIKENFIISETTGRIRFMYIEPGGYILPHHDRETKKLSEINVAISNPQGCTFRFVERGNIPFEDGTAFIIDTSNKHMVHNNTNKPRLHIILHTNINDEIIERSYEKSYYN